MKKYFTYFLFFLSFVGVQLLQAQIDTVHLRLSEWFGKRGNTYALPIYSDDSLKTIDSLVSGEFTVNHNSTVMDIIGFDTVGTILGGKQSVLFNPASKKIAFIHSQPITGQGVLVYLLVTIKANAVGTSSITLSGAMLNEGTPVVSFNSGSIRPMDIFINPKNPPPNKVVGDTVQFSASGDVTPPLSWSLTDTSVAKIDSLGRVIGKKIGQTNVYVVDWQGLSDQSNALVFNSPALNSLTMSINDTSILQNQIFNLPIRVSDVTSLGIISSQWRLSFNQNTLEAKGVSTVGTIAQAWGNPTVNFGSNYIDVAIAGADTITGNGILAYVQFKVKRFATQNSGLTLSNVLFNEDINGAIQNGFFIPIPGPTITILPNIQALTKGDTLTYFANGGAAPYKWFASDTSVASVDSLTGKVTAKKQGNLTLSAFDAQGFDGTSVIAVNSFKATLPNIGIAVGDSNSVPIIVSNVTGLGILAKQIKISYDTTKVRFTQLITSGTISDGMLTAVKDSAGVIRIAFSGTNPITGVGTFANLRFKHQPPAGDGQISPLNFVEYQANEPSPLQPSATLQNGQITILPPPNVNPQFTKMMGDTTINEDQQLTFQYIATDSNNDQLKYFAQNIPAGMAMDSISGLLSWKPNFNQAGNYNITVLVFDGKGGSTFKNSSITVLNTNRAPIFTKVMGSDTTINEDQQLTFQYSATDPDGNQLKYFIQNAPVGMTLDSMTGTLNWKPSFIQSGNYSFTVQAEDNFKVGVSKQTNITVANNNRSPVFTKAMGADTTINEDQQLTFQFLANDSDGEQTKFFIQNQPGGMTIDSMTGILNWRPSFTQAGNFNFIVFARDPFGANASRQTTIAVLNVNRPPVFTQVPPDTVFVLTGQTIGGQYSASDPDNDNFIFSLVEFPQGATITAGGDFEWTPSNQQVGTFRMIVKIADATLSTNDTTYFTVTASNISPTFTVSLNDTTINEDQQLTFQYLASDPNNDQLKYFTQNAPAGMILDSISGALNWKPSFTQSGNYSFTALVVDGKGGSASKNTNITVLSTNRAPFFTQVPPETTFAEVAQQINLQYSGSDPDNDNLSFSGIEMPSGAILTSSGQFSWIPIGAQIGINRLIVRVSDASLSADDTVYFVISTDNNPPQFASILSDTTINENQPLTFSYTATDVDNDPLTFSLRSQSPAGLTISSTGTLNWTPDFTQAGEHSVVVEVSDQILSTHDTVKISVLNVNRPPQFVVMLPDIIVFVDTAINFQYAAVDPDNDNLTFSFVKSPSGAVIQSNGTFSWKPTAVGRDTFIVSVNDGTVSVLDTAILTVTGFPFAEVSQTVFDFGSLTFGGSKTLSTVVKNNGVVPLLFQALPQFNLPPDQNFVLDTVGASIILPGQQKTISITYTPKTVGGHGTGYVFVTNDFRSPSYVFTANGNSIAKLVITKRVVVDVTHNSTISLTDTVSGLGQLFQYLSQSGIQINFSNQILRPSGNDILLLVAPQTNYSRAEIDSIKNFVNNGGFVIALGNGVQFEQVGSNDALNSLLKDTSWTTNLSLNNDIVVDSSSNFFSPFAPLLTRFIDSKHPYLTNVDTLVFIGSASVNTTEPAIPFGSTSDKGITIGGQPKTQPAVIGFNKIGKGKILVMGDADAWRVDSENDTIPPNIAIKDNLAFVLNILSITEDYEVKLPAKTPNEQYQLVSIPYDLENGDIKTVLKQLGDPNPLVWRLFGRYDPTTQKYSEFPSTKFNSFKRGEAYWLITRGTFDLTPGKATIVPVQNYYPIKIGPGYNIIGNPFPYKVSWKNSIHDSVQKIIWGFNGSTFKAESLVMNPYAGYFVKNLTKDSITIYINPQDITNLAKSSDVAEVFQENEWKISIGAVSGKASDEENFAGVARNAKEEFDTFDVSEPPPSPTNYVIVRFQNKEWKQHPGSYAMDMRPASSEGLYWDFEVITAQAQAGVDLSLKQLGNIPGDFTLYLIDKTNERAIPLNGSHHYHFTMMKNETRRNFRLIAGKSQFIEENTEGIPLVAVDYALAQNYPNPFNPSTRIQYSLGHSGVVSLEIYNVLGQRVRTLTNEFQPIGNYGVEWNGKDDANRSVASGVYFYKIAVVSNGENVFYTAKKMILMK